MQHIKTAVVAALAACVAGAIVCCGAASQNTAPPKAVAITCKELAAIEAFAVTVEVQAGASADVIATTRAVLSVVRAACATVPAPSQDAGVDAALAPAPAVSYRADTMHNAQCQCAECFVSRSQFTQQGAPPPPANAPESHAAIMHSGTRVLVRANPLQVGAVINEYSADDGTTWYGSEAEAVARVKWSAEEWASHTASLALEKISERARVAFVREVIGGMRRSVWAGSVDMARGEMLAGADACLAALLLIGDDEQMEREASERERIG